MNSSDSDYEGNDLSSNLNHDSDSEFYVIPYIDSDGDIHYGDARPCSTSLQDARSKISDLEVHTVAHIADWGAWSADNCVSIETAKRESVNTGLSAIIWLYG